jgi:hypothetical protein
MMMMDVCVWVDDDEQKGRGWRGNGAGLYRISVQSVHIVVVD